MNNPGAYVLIIGLNLITAKFGFAAEELRDPTTPFGYEVRKKSAEKLVLQAIFDRQGKRTAIINGVQVREGKSISGATITRISDKKVYYQRDGEGGVLSLRASIR